MHEAKNTGRIFRQALKCLRHTTTHHGWVGVAAGSRFDPPRTCEKLGRISAFWTFSGFFSFFWIFSGFFPFPGIFLNFRRKLSFPGTSNPSAASTQFPGPKPPVEVQIFVFRKHFRTIFGFRKVFRTKIYFRTKSAPNYTFTRAQAESGY